MADRPLFRDAFVMADLPGADAETVMLTTLNPYAEVVVDDARASALGENRFAYTIPAALMDVPGVWENQWMYADRIFHQTFTVGAQPLSGITKFECRAEACARVAEIHYGWFTQAGVGHFADDALIGGTGEYIYWWVLRGSDTNDAGRPQRVVAFNGSALELANPFLDIPASGEEYVMTKINPREADLAMKNAVAELAPLARIEVFYPAVPIIEGVLTLPTGLVAITHVTRETSVVSASSWELRPGRQLAITDVTTDLSIGITGLRDAAFPVWDDSILETDPASTIARTAMHLHAHRALGSGIDPEEHLRRQLASQDEFERAKRNSVGRIPPSTRLVIQ